jgi:hypothetical protein
LHCFEDQADIRRLNRYLAKPQRYPKSLIKGIFSQVAVGARQAKARLKSWSSQFRRPKARLNSWSSQLGKPNSQKQQKEKSVTI